MQSNARLHDLTQALRRRQRPVAAAALAKALGVSQRTIYRDVQALIALGAPIEGEPGSGYRMQQDWRMPAPVFTEHEMQALAVGARWLAAQALSTRLEGASAEVSRAHAATSAAAEVALLKISRVLPAGAALMAEQLFALMTTPQANVDIATLRRAIRLEHKLRISLPADGAAASLVVWPISLVDFDAVQLLIAWCEASQGIRHFRTDQLGVATLLDERYPQTRLALITAWHAQEAAAAPVAGP